MEGEADEELDYDVNEDFQDDEENNTFYRDENDEEEAKVLEVCETLPFHRWPFQVMRTSFVVPRQQLSGNLRKELQLTT